MQISDLSVRDQSSQNEKSFMVQRSSVQKEEASTVSFYAELPEALQKAMAGFIERYPNWDQYRLIQAALAGFLVQNGVDSRPITRLYVGNMFGSESFIEEI